MVERLSQDEIDNITSSPINKTIDFDRIETIVLPRTDILGCKITGNAFGESHSIGKGNIVDCNLIKFTAKTIDFEYVDFKDCNVKDSKL